MIHHSPAAAADQIAKPAAQESVLLVGHQRLSVLPAQAQIVAPAVLAPLDWFSRSAAQGNQYAQFFLERQNDLRPPSVMLAVTQLLYHMSRIFQDNSVPPAVPTGQQVDRKLRRKIQEKKIAMGHKPDDHEEAQNQGGMVMGGM